MMRLLLWPLTFFLLCTGCVRNGDENLIESSTTIVGKWEQTFHADTIFFMDVTKSTLKLYYYDKSKRIKYLINGDYRDKGSSVYTKYVSSDTYRDLRYNMPHCDLLFFDDIRNGFIRIE